MPQEWSITFSPGQKPTGNDKERMTSPASTDSPIYEFGASPNIGAYQTSPSEGTFSLPQPSLNPASLGETRNPVIPIGAMFQPRLKLAVLGSDPALKTRQLWEGTITEVLKNGFVAVLMDKTNPSNPEEQVSFEFDQTEISPDDQQFISPGSTFYWVIGNERTKAGQVKNVSMVQFRRVPAWTQDVLKKVVDRARQLRESFQEEA